MQKQTVNTSVLNVDNSRLERKKYQASGRFQKLFSSNFISQTSQCQPYACCYCKLVACILHGQSFLSAQSYRAFCVHENVFVLRELISHLLNLTKSRKDWLSSISKGRTLLLVKGDPS